MKKLFIPGPLLLFFAGLSGRFSYPDYLWVSFLVAAVSIPLTLMFIAASFRAFGQAQREK